MTRQRRMSVSEPKKLFFDLCHDERINNCGSISFNRNSTCQQLYYLFSKCYLRENTNLTCNIIFVIFCI